MIFISQWNIVYKTGACKVTWENGFVLNEDFIIKIKNKFVKIKYFEPDWNGNRVYNSMIIEFDISW